MPAGVTYQFAPAQVYLSGSGTSPSTLTLSSTASTPGGTYPLVITGTLQATGDQRIATFSLGTQVTTFQVTSVTGSAIVHNTGQEVQVTHNVPASDAPGYTTCGSADPNVTCQVISTAPGAVTLGITASTSAVHGTRVLSLNGGAGTFHAGIADESPVQPNLGPLDVSVSPSALYVEGGQSTPVSITLTGVAVTGTPCDDDTYCFANVQLTDAFCQAAVGLNYWFPYDPQGNTITGWIDPQLGNEGNYQVKVTWTFDSWDPDGVGSTVTGCGPVTVADPTAVPTITSITSLGGPARGPVGGAVDVVINGSNFPPNPGVNASGISVSIISSNASVIHATFTIPTSQPGGNASVTVTGGAQPSNLVNFYVQVPTGLVRQTYPGNPPAGAPNGYGPLETPDGTAANGTVVNAGGQVMPLPPNQCGVYRNLAYLIVDQEVPAQVIQGLNNVQILEAFSNFSGTLPAPTPPAPQSLDLVNCPGGIGSSQCGADFTDLVYMGHTNTCLAVNETQSFTQAFSVTIGTSPGAQFPITTTNSVSRGNFNGTLKADVTISKP
jgi:hypothetical protein